MDGLEVGPKSKTDEKCVQIKLFGQILFGIPYPGSSVKPWLERTPLGSNFVVPQSFESTFFDKVYLRSKFRRAGLSDELRMQSRSEEDVIDSKFHESNSHINHAVDDVRASMPPILSPFLIIFFVGVYL